MHDTRLMLTADTLDRLPLDARETIRMCCLSPLRDHPTRAGLLVVDLAGYRVAEIADYCCDAGLACAVLEHDQRDGGRAAMMSVG